MKKIVLNKNENFDLIKKDKDIFGEKSITLQK